MNTTMIGFGVDTNLNDIISYIENHLIEYNVPYEKTENLHISIVQINEKVKKDEMVRLINSIEPVMSLRPKKISILNGKMCDFITLELHASNEFVCLYKKIDEQYNIIKYNDEIKPHISLFQILSGFASENFMLDIMEKIDFPKKIKTGKVELWGQKFEIEYEKKY